MNERDYVAVGMEFYDVNFSYIDLDDMSEHYASVPEQGGGKLIPDGMCNPGQVYTVSRGKSGMLGVFRLESQMLPGNGKIERTGLGNDSKYSFVDFASAPADLMSAFQLIPYQSAEDAVFKALRVE